jgi:transcriptional regulator with XRE-family HTH domain
MEQEKYKMILRLKSQLENYITGPQFEVLLTFSYFFNEYIRRQGLSDKDFAVAIGVSDAAISQYINNRRKPTKEFLIRLELHSCGLFPALNWIKLLHKEKEYEIINDIEIRIIQRQNLKYQMDLAGN